MRAHRKRWVIGTLVAVAVVAIGLWIALPAIVLRVANDRLAHIGEYSGRIDDVDLDVLHGGITIHGMHMIKPAAHTQTPFFEADRIAASLQWNALIHGRIVGEAEVFHPVVNLVQGPTSRESQLGTGVNWPAEVRALVPFDFNRIVVHDGVVTFRAPGIDTDESLTMRNLRVTVRNLANAEPDRTHDGFADLDLTADIMGKAPLMIRGRVNPNAAAPTFDLDMTLRDAHLVDVNPWLRKFLDVDAERGTFSMYTEVAAADGAFHGYAKPILEDPKFLDLDEPDESVLRKAWEAVVQLATEIFKNHPQDQVATEIPLSGQFDDPKADILAAIVNVLRNAFVGAFTHSLEGTVSLGDPTSRKARADNERNEDAQAKNENDRTKAHAG